MKTTNKLLIIALSLISTSVLANIPTIQNNQSSQANQVKLMGKISKKISYGGQPCYFIKNKNQTDFLACFTQIENRMFYKNRTVEVNGKIIGSVINNSNNQTVLVVSIDYLSFMYYKPSHSNASINSLKFSSVNYSNPPIHHHPNTHQVHTHY